MKKEQYAKNGNLVSAIKRVDEMTNEEKKAIRPVDDGRFNSYHVQYNKAGKLLHVSGADLKEQPGVNHEPNLLDGLQVLFNPNKHSKNYQDAKKRLGLSNKRINDARKAFNSKNRLTI